MVIKIRLYFVVLLIFFQTSVSFGTEWILSYDSYLADSYRRQLIDEFQDATKCSLNVLPKTGPVKLLFSDFDVVQIQNYDCLRGLKNLTRVRGVFRQHSFGRTPLNYDSVNNGSEIEESSFKSRNVNNFFNQINFFSKVGNKKMSTSSIAYLLSAQKLWSLGHTGKNVRVAVFDTGLPENHPDFRNIKERTDWTNESQIDAVGHGTFVASVIAGTNPECLGIAPDVELHIYRVFTNKQVSYTSWFLDAFNYAIMRGIDIINLSIGGPDFMDQPFIEKVWELTANGVVMISAIGNDGPQYGTLNNPADQMDVIGVGGINYDDQVAKFSSRGMTTWELPSGYGRVKPDLVTYGALVRGSNLRGKCTTLSGTSVASPVVTGAAALLMSAVEDKSRINPAILKQVLMASANRLPSSANIFEQGHGKLNLTEAYRMLRGYSPQISLSPSYIDTSECPYFWPYCTQSLFYGSLPLIVNVTILNGLSVSGHIVDQPQWYAYTNENGLRLKVAFKFSRHLWPWSGWLAVVIGVSELGQNWRGIASGHVQFTVETDGTRTTLNFPLKIQISLPPMRQKRILWDQFHSLRYPPYYFPRDNLKIKDNPLDWNADHIHTNFRDLYQHLESSGYTVEVLGSPLTCFNAKDYFALLLIDVEEEFFPEEISKLKNDVNEHGLNVIVFADWFNVSVINKIKFFDENTKRWWTPETGGSNVPALNLLLNNWNISLSGVVAEGDFDLAGHSIYYASGTTLSEFPEEGVLFFKNLKNQGDQIILKFTNLTQPSIKVPIMGLLKPWKFTNSLHPGRLAVYGDSNCLDFSVNMKKNCFWLLETLLDYVNTGHLPRSLISESSLDILKTDHSLKPSRPSGNSFAKASNVVESFDNDGKIYYKPLPNCLEWSWAEPILSNASSPQVLRRHYKLLSVDRLSIDIHAQIDLRLADSEWDSHVKYGFDRFKTRSRFFGRLFSIIFNLPTLALILVIAFIVLFKKPALYRKLRRRLRAFL